MAEITINQLILDLETHKIKINNHNKKKQLLVLVILDFKMKILRIQEQDLIVY